MPEGIVRPKRQDDVGILHRPVQLVLIYACPRSVRISVGIAGIQFNGPVIVGPDLPRRLLQENPAAAPPRCACYW